MGAAAPLPLMLEYLLELKSSGLAMSSIKVHLAAIFAFHQEMGGTSAFVHSTTKCFLKSLLKVYPEVRQPMLAWDLNMGLKCLTSPPFEPLATCSFLHLPMKMAFLVTITSTRRVSEIGVLMADPPYSTFFKDKVMLCPHPKYLLKVTSAFHMNQPIHLPTFHPKPHGTPTGAALHTLRH